MAIDTRDKRHAALNSISAGQFKVLPNPQGAVDVEGRYNLASLYGGNQAAGPPPAGDGAAGGGDVGTFSLLNQHF